MYKTLFLLTFKTNFTLQNSEAERAALTGEDVAQTKQQGMWRDRWGWAETGAPGAGGARGPRMMSNTFSFLLSYP